jgi:hypothetical protein
MWRLCRWCSGSSPLVALSSLAALSWTWQVRRSGRAMAGDDERRRCEQCDRLRLGRSARTPRVTREAPKMSGRICAAKPEKPEKGRQSIKEAAFLAPPYVPRPEVWTPPEHRAYPSALRTNRSKMATRIAMYAGTPSLIPIRVSP